MPTEGRRTPTVLTAPKRDWLWPALIAGGLLVVISVNVLFIVVAVSGADEVVPSYAAESR